MKTVNHALLAATPVMPTGQAAVEQGIICRPAANYVELLRNFCRQAMRRKCLKDKRLGIIAFIAFVPLSA